MFDVYAKNSVVEIFFDHFEDSCVSYAVQDLKSDIGRIGLKQPNVRRYLPGEEDGYIVVGCMENERFREFIENKHIDTTGVDGGWEQYKLITFGDSHQNLAIFGSDPRGTMWGVYEFCEQYLGIDPLYFWTDHEPEVTEELRLKPMEVVGSPMTCRFRGWFINDEDLFKGWKLDGDKQNDRFTFPVNYQPILQKIIETALRLKQNLLIPCSHLDIMDPAQEYIVKMVTERGLFVSQHHIEPLGVSGFTFERYWGKRKMEVTPSYVSNRDRYEEIWTDYAKRWAKYPNVIWQLGLRGKGDHPVWHNDANVPESMEGRGKLISSAIAKQKDIITKALGHSNFYSTTTLWMEGMGLQKEGYLTFPEDTIIINADFGPTQMWGEGFYTVKREEARKYGLYNHVAFWSCGPHLVQGTSLDKIYYNLKNAFDMGDTAYCITNVTNFREMVMEVKCNSKMTWDIQKYRTDSFLSEWSTEQFGAENTAAVTELYRKFFDAYHKIDDTLIPGHMLLLDGMAKKVGNKLIQIIQGKGLVPERLQNTRLYEFNSQEDFVMYYKSATADSLVRWKELYGAACAILPGIAEKRQGFFISNIIVQAEIITGLYLWVYYLSLAAEEKIIPGRGVLYERYVAEAVFALEKSLIDREKSEQGKWKGWYTNDQLIDIRSLVERTKCLFGG